MSYPTRIIVCVLVAAGLVSCKKKEVAPTPPPSSTQAAAKAPAAAAVSVVSATLGAAVGADKKVTSPKEAFTKSDTIHLSVDTAGSGKASLKAKWSYQLPDGRKVLVKEETQLIEAAGRSTTEFNATRREGWPVGKYQVELFLGNKIVQTKNYVVQ